MVRHGVLGLLVGTATACTALIPNGTQRTMECEGSRSAGQEGRTGQATCQPLPEFGNSCEERFTVPQTAADILWVVDNSGSMTEEIKDIREQLNRFSQRVVDSGIDVRIVMISERGTGSNAVCVPEPLAGPNCGDSARFMHPGGRGLPVDSTDGPDVLLDNYALYEPFLRDNVARAIVFVTDDDAAMSHGAFQGALASHARLAGAVVHAVVGLNNTDCPDIATVGETYVRLADATGGLKVPICCNNYDLLVDQLANDVAGQVRRFLLSREVASAGTVRVYLEDSSGTRTPITTGWTYDAVLHAVTFDDSARPAPGSTIVITYGSR